MPAAGRNDAIGQQGLDWSSGAVRTRLAVTAILVFIACTGGPQPTVAPADTTEGSRGQQLYSSTCQNCHGGATGGSMMDIPPPHNANGHTWHHPDCELVETVLNGPGPMAQVMRQMMDGSPDTPRMPAFKGALSEEDVTAILGYIKGWWTEDQRQFQADITARAC